jgi:hypothetical protein
MNMDNRQQRDVLRAELQKRGLPRAYIKRLVDELDDHFSDLADHLVSSERNHDMSAARMPDYRVDELNDRMGSPTQLAIFAAEQYRSRSFFGRHPVFTFLVTPLPLLVACWATFWLALVVVALPAIGLGYVAEHLLGWSVAAEDHPWFQCLLLAFLSWEIVALAPLTTAWLLCRVARRNALDWRWPLAACVLLAFVVSLLTFSWHPKFLPSETGSFTIGIPGGISTRGILDILLPKFALALSIGLALIWRERSRLDGHISDTPATIPTRPAA